MAHENRWFPNNSDAGDGWDISNTKAHSHISWADNLVAAWFWSLLHRGGGQVKSS